MPFLHLYAKILFRYAQPILRVDFTHSLHFVKRCFWMKIDETVLKIAEPLVTGYGFDLVDVEYVREKDERYLRVFIDKPGGITVDDCQSVSEELGRVLDEADFIKEPYIFEVSSPGLERVLKKDREFERYCGELIEIKLYKAVDGKKTMQGILKGFDDENLYIEIEDEVGAYERKQIAIAKRVFIF